ncbi:hypothetical protein [Burkholderia sp. LMG 21824]|uniref:hypothetical protein n=1 Tax=Burkholderia sp. LMG 21824 TaxID=3158172 RepID=UPI003C2BB315
MEILRLQDCIAFFFSTVSVLFGDFRRPRDCCYVVFIAARCNRERIACTFNALHQLDAKDLHVDARNTSARAAIGSRARMLCESCMPKCQRHELISTADYKKNEFSCIGCDLSAGRA